MKKQYFISILIISYFFIGISFCKTCFGQEFEGKTKNRVTTVILEKFGKPHSVIPFKQWVSMKPGIKEWKLKYGTYKDDLVEFNIGIFDKNKNGIFSDENEDVLFVGNKSDSAFEYTPMISSRASVIHKTNNFLNYNDTYFYKITQTNENELNVEKVKKEDNYISLIFYDKLPNESFELLNEKGTINLTTLNNGKPTKLIFFKTWCVHCWEEMDYLQHKELYKSYNIVSLFSGGDIIQARSLIKEKKYPWTFIKSKEKINKIYGQNGFPYIVDFDKNGVLIN